MKTCNIKDMTKENQSERLSAAVRSVLNGTYTKEFAVIMYALPSELELFKNTILKYTKNVFC